MGFSSFSSFLRFRINSHKNAASTKDKRSSIRHRQVKMLIDLTRKQSVYAPRSRIKTRGGKKSHLHPGKSNLIAYTSRAPRWVRKQNHYEQELRISKTHIAPPTRLARSLFLSKIALHVFILLPHSVFTARGGRGPAPPVLLPHSPPCRGAALS